MELVSLGRFGPWPYRRPAGEYRSNSEYCAWLPFDFKVLELQESDLSGYFKVGTSSFTLGGNRKTAPVAERLGRNLKTGRSLLAFVFGAIDQADDASHYFNVECATCGDALRRMAILHIIFKHCVLDFIGRQRVAVFLVRPQFRGGRLLQRSLRDHRASRIHIFAEPIHQCFWHVGNDRQATNHVAVEGTIADAQLALVSGGKHNRSEFNGKSHQERAPGARLDVFFGHVFSLSREHIPQRLAVRLVRGVDRKQLETNSELRRQGTRIMDGAGPEMGPGHADADHFSRPARIGGDDG